MIGAAAVFERANARVYKRLGEDALYTPQAGAPATVRILLDRTLASIGDTAQVNARTAVLAVRVAEVADAPRRGETFAASGRTWKVDSALPSDEFEHRMLVS